MGNERKPAEAEKRLHRCCFSGPAIDNLNFFENPVNDWLQVQIQRALADGYKTFLCGMRLGADITAGHLVREIREKDPSVHLICVEPWPGMSKDWAWIWKSPHDYLISNVADYVKVISKTWQKDVYRQTNEYMVDHCSRLIAYYDEKDENADDTWEMIEYAVHQGLEIVTNRAELVQDYRNAIARPGKYGLPE